uniref:Lon proteolytic domain-containing protein n=1 Tax=Meloidogyne enterolobii TaxID=390850 RepID=A0A6V7Y5D4_MELEN|nr:unnamed protein product [Meloidogyne enterolobii]
MRPSILTRYEQLTGPSCGDSFTIALLSIILGQKPPEDLVATGQITFDGDLKKIGGIKFKLIEANAIGRKSIILTEENKDYFDTIFFS